MKMPIESPCTIPFSKAPIPLKTDWNDAVWNGPDTLEMACVRPESSDHHPRVRVKLRHDNTSVSVRFLVHDRYVRSVHTRFQDSVCRDSCVEWFVEPCPGKGYINFEINAGGTLLSSYIEDPTRTPQGFKKWVPVPEDAANELTIRHTLPKVVEPEISEPTDWEIGLRVPISYFERFVGPLGAFGGQTWRANFYKCGDQTSHPHWISWKPVAVKNFHRPMDFAPIHFQPSNSTQHR